jgi:Flagellar biosynthesis protein, FliO
LGKADIMSDSVIYIVTVTLLIALACLAFWIARQSLGLGGMTLFQGKVKRVGLVESTSLDGRRRLVLVRRDNVEHLIMTGGPVDVVIETGIPMMGMRGANGLRDAMSRADPSMNSEAAYLSDDVPLIMHRDQPN